MLGRKCFDGPFSVTGIADGSHAAVVQNIRILETRPEELRRASFADQACPVHLEQSVVGHGVPKTVKSFLITIRAYVWHTIGVPGDFPGVGQVRCGRTTEDDAEK